MYYMGFSYGEAYRLPIWQRIWFIDRISEEFKRASESGSDVSKAAHSNSAEQRALAGRSRTNVPANQRRFT